MAYNKGSLPATGYNSRQKTEGTYNLVRMLPGFPSMRIFPFSLNQVWIEFGEVANRKCVDYFKEQTRI